MVGNGEKVFGSEGKRFQVTEVVVVVDVVIFSSVDEECADQFPAIIR
jgi:hypothetical protein